MCSVPFHLKKTFPLLKRECKYKVFIRISNNSNKEHFYFTTTLFFTSSTKVFAGLNDGMLCAGIMMVVFFEMLRPVFSARSFTIKMI